MDLLKRAGYWVRRTRVRIWLPVLLLTLAFFQNCTQGFSVLGSSSSHGTAGDSSAGDPASSKANEVMVPGKYLSKDFTLASDSRFAALNQDFTSALTFYADAEIGDDANPGTNSSPMKTIEAVKAAARKVLPTAKAPVVIVLRGEFRLKATLEFTNADSGANGNFAIYYSDPAKPASLSGGETLPNQWAPVAGSSLYSINVGSKIFRNLVINGVMATRSVSASPLLQSSIGANGVVDCTSCGLPTLSQASPVEVVVGFQWQESRCRGTWNPDQTVTLASTCFAATYNNNTAPRRIMKLENARALISGPGQWALDATSGTLYYWPRKNEDLTKAVVSIPQRTRLVSANGLTNVAFIGLRFHETDWQQVNTDSGFADYQADTYHVGANFDWIPAAFECLGCKSTVVMDSEFSQMDTSALRIGAGSKGNLIFHNHIHDVGASGLQIGDPSPSDPARAVTETFVEDNDIHAVAQDYDSSVGIYVYYAASTSLRHNDVHDLPYTGISVGWGWTQTAVANLHDNIVQANHVYNVMNVLQDGAGIYMNSAQNGSRVEHNFVHDTRPGPTGLNAYISSNGVYLDNGCSGITVNNNSTINITSQNLFLQNIVQPFAVNNDVINDGIDEGIIRNLAGVRNLPIHPLAPGETLAFGGMYGYGAVTTPTLSEFVYPNSATGRDSCPKGYAAVKILGTYNVDYPVYYCYKILAAGAQADYDFGGLYGYGYQKTYANPQTGADSCPSGFTSHQVLGTTNVDWPLYYCIRPHAAGGLAFGGLYGTGGDNSKRQVFAHPVTGTDSCPNGAAATPAIGTPNADWTIYSCGASSP